MGKKKGKKNKNNSKNNENSINNNNPIPNNEEEDKDTNGKNSELKIDSKVLLDAINSNNSSTIYDLTTFLTNFNYDILCQEEDKREKEIFVITSINFLIPYLNLYFSPNLNEYEKQIKHNIISSIINIFSNFSENSKYEINFKYIYNKILSEIFYQSFLSFINELKTNNITGMIKYKTMLILFDLFQLYIDIIKNDEKINSSKGLINYDIIINILIKDYLFNNDVSIDNEIKNRAQFLLFSLTTNFYIELNDKNSTKMLLNKTLDNSNKTNLQPFLHFTSFYLAVCNKDINALKVNLQIINDLTNDVDKFNKDINDIIHFLSKYFNIEEENKESNDNDDNVNMNVINNNNNEINISDEEMEQKINSFLLNCKTLYGLLKIYSDIIENLNECGGTIPPSDDIFLNNMTVSINQLFNHAKKAINQCYSDNFISSLIKILNNIEKNNISSYFMNNNDSILRIKEYLNEIILLIIGIINNVVIKIDKKFKKDDINIILSIIHTKLNNYKSSDEQEMTLIILLFRNILEKKIINIENIIEGNNKDEDLNSLDYKLLFCIFNYFLNDDYIKINIIDIVAFIYSTEITNDKNWYEIIKEINNLLITLLYNEKSIEIVSHVINAFMDIYQGDDPVLNDILKNSNVLNMMVKGTKPFKQKMENLFKTNEITDDTYEYISETLTNMKRFIKYKENI